MIKNSTCVRARSISVAATDMAGHAQPLRNGVQLNHHEVTGALSLVGRVATHI